MLKEIKAWVLAWIVSLLVKAVLMLPPAGIYAFSRIFRDELKARSTESKQGTLEA